MAVSGACIHNNQGVDHDDGADMLVAIVFGLGLSSRCNHMNAQRGLPFSDRDLKSSGACSGRR